MSGDVLTASPPRVVGSRSRHVRMPSRSPLAEVCYRADIGVRRPACPCKSSHTPQRPSAGASAAGGCDAALWHALLLRGFHWNKARGRPADRLADRLSPAQDGFVGAARRGRLLSKATWARAEPITHSTATATTAAYAFIILVPPEAPTSDSTRSRPPPLAGGGRLASTDLGRARGGARAGGRRESAAPGRSAARYPAGRR